MFDYTTRTVVGQPHAVIRRAIDTDDGQISGKQ